MELSSIAQPLVEPLSERELEVQRLMATGLKYQEITGKLVISVNTGHHHTRKIYGKLDVNSRALIHKNAKYFGVFLLVISTFSDFQMSIFSLYS